MKLASSSVLRCRSSVVFLFALLCRCRCRCLFVVVLSSSVRRVEELWCVAVVVSGALRTVPARPGPSPPAIGARVAPLVGRPNCDCVWLSQLRLSPRARRCIACSSRVCKHHETRKAASHEVSASLRSSPDWCPWRHSRREHRAPCLRPKSKRWTLWRT